jgi:hypothetical protein
MRWQRFARVGLNRPVRLKCNSFGDKELLEAKTGVKNSPAVSILRPAWLPRAARKSPETSNSCLLLSDSLEYTTAANAWFAAFWDHNCVV